MLFPYSVQRGNLVGHPRWTQDASVTAADVYDIIGSPPVFRLRFAITFHLIQCPHINADVLNHPAL